MQFQFQFLFAIISSSAVFSFPSLAHTDNNQFQENPNSYLYRAYQISLEDYNRHFVNFLNGGDSQSLSEIERAQNNGSFEHFDHNIPNFYSRLLINYITQRELPRSLLTSTSLLESLNYVSNQIRIDGLQTIRNRYPQLGNVWIIQEILPRNLDQNLVQDARPNQRMWTSLNEVVIRALNESVGITNELRTGIVPTLSRLTLPAIYSHPQIIREINVTHHHDSLSILNDIRANVLANANLPQNHYRRDFTTILEYAISGLLPQVSNNIWLRTTFYPESVFYDMGRTREPYDNLPVPREYIRRTFAGQFNDDGNFSLLTHLNAEANLIPNSIPSAIENMSFVGLNDRENYVTDANLLHFLGLNFEEDYSRRTASSNSSSQRGSPERTIIPNSTNTLRRRLSLNSIRNFFATCKFKSNERRLKRELQHIIYSEENMFQTNKDDNECSENLYMEQPFRIKGSLFQFKTNENKSILFSNKPVNKSLSLKFGENNSTEFEFAITKDGFYKIIYTNFEDNINYCLTKYKLNTVSFSECNELKSNEQKWDITKIENYSSKFSAIISKNSSCLEVKNDQFVLEDKCDGQSFNAQIFNISETSKSNFNPIQFYTHSIVLENQFILQKKSKSSELNKSNTEWKIGIENIGYNGYKLADNETLEKYVAKFPVSKSSDSIHFTLTKNGNIYTKLGGTWFSMPLCLTASSLDDGSWQHVGFKPCNKSQDKFQLWDLSFITNRANVSDVFITSNLKLKNANICLRMKNKGTNWGDLFLSKCDGTTENSYLLKLKFIPTLSGLSFKENLNLSYKQIKHDDTYIAPTSKNWINLSNNLNWLFRYEPESMRIMGYDYSSNNDNSPYCLAKYNGNSYLNIEQSKLQGNYVYFELKKCNYEQVEANEQFLLRKKLMNDNKLKFEIYSPWQEHKATTIDTLFKTQHPYYYSDPKNILCTGKDHSGYLWIGNCLSFVQSTWNQGVLFEWNK